MIREKEIAIAYLDKNGSGFCGELPWLELVPCGMEDIKNVLADISRFGCKRVTPFYMEAPYPEEVSWEYVNSHKIGPYAYET